MDEYVIYHKVADCGIDFSIRTKKQIKKNNLGFLLGEKTSPSQITKSVRDSPRIPNQKLKNPKAQQT